MLAHYNAVDAPDFSGVSTLLIDIVQVSLGTDGAYTEQCSSFFVEESEKNLSPRGWNRKKN